MANISSKATARLQAGLKKFIPVLESAKKRDVNESDTVVIVTDILHEVFGYDKYSDITSEHAIRCTYCDLAIKLDGRLAMLIEVKAVGLDLKEQHVKQAVDYAANQGCDWVVLTNGIIWRVYKVLFEKPIDQELVVEFELSSLNPRREDDLEVLWMLSKEGWQKERLDEYHEKKQVLSRFTIAQLLLSDSLLDVLRRELRRVSPDAKISADDICTVLRSEVVKRELLDGAKADAAKRLVSRAAGRALRATKSEPPTKGAAETSRTSANSSNDESM